ncbi:MAG TPA: HlyD family secretion protein [Hyphomicrobiales bacterium]|nr:HlyD family secretion protein [Hyphomicrobiales bacterium]
MRSVPDAEEAPARVRRVETEPTPVRERAETPPAEAAPKKSRRRRVILLVVVPLVAIVLGGLYYMSGGGTISTDNAYVGAPMVVISPQISGAVDRVFVREGQHVKAGDPLFEIDPAPYKIAVQQAIAAQEAAKLELAALKQQYRKSLADIETAKAQVAFQQSNYDRIAPLANRNISTKADLDKARADLASAKAQLVSVQQASQMVLAQLAGDPDLPIVKFPDAMKAAAALAEAERNLSLTTIRSPIDGVATQTDNTSPALPSVVDGKFMAPGTAALAVVSDTHVWVDANPKETELEGVKVGSPATVVVDAYPGHTFQGHVESISPGTGAQFSLLPAQNASGNWVKVVQRITVRVAVDRKPDDPVLRSGMSADVTIDTGKKSLLEQIF